MIDDPDVPKAGIHRELDAHNIRKSEWAVKQVMTAIRSFTNPWRIPIRDRLYSLASGAAVPHNVEEDCLRAEECGRLLKAQFIQERLKPNPEKAFYDPIPRQKLHTMERNNKSASPTSSQGKLVQYREQSDLAFKLLVKSQMMNESLDLEELMKYPLAAVCHCLGTPDGFFTKTNKASMLHFIMEDHTEETPYPNGPMFIQDGNALFHSLTDLPHTFRDICFQILDQMKAKRNFIFSTDSYKPDSIKSQERLRRGCSEPLVLEGPSTRKPRDFKLFLMNDSNKQKICQLLLEVWSSNLSATRLENCQTSILIVDGTAHQLVTRDGVVSENEVFDLRSDQEETDTRVVLYIRYAQEKGFQSAVVRTPDTDIFFILLHHAHDLTITVYIDIGTGKNRRLICITEIANEHGRDWCRTLLGFYVFTGEDCTSAFKGKGKVAPLKKLMKYPRYHRYFGMLGDEWTVDEETHRMIETFTCIMYGYPKETSVNQVRCKMLKKMVGKDNLLTNKSKIDLSRLPPCQDALLPHVRRVNYRVASYKRANVPMFESPRPWDENQGWCRTDGVLEPLWSVGPILPESLVDILGSGDLNDDDNEEYEMDVEVDDNEYDDDDDNLDN